MKRYTIILNKNIFIGTIIGKIANKRIFKIEIRMGNHSTKVHKLVEIFLHSCNYRITNF